MDEIEDSILISIKKLLGLDEDYTPFDTDITIHINTFLSVLNQLGVGTNGFAISGKEDTWEDFLGSQITFPLNEIKTYVYLRTKLVFDPPSSSIVAQAIKESIDELGWRIITTVDTH